MTIYYSSSTSGFYDTEINTNIPSDGVEITSAEHQALLKSLSEGKVLAPGADGKPTAVDRPKPPLDEYKTYAKAQIDVLRKATEQEGLNYKFPDDVMDVIQLRNTRDLLNVQSMVTVAGLLKAAGSTDPLPFQGESNTTHVLTPDEMVAMGLAVSGYIQSLYAKAWPIKAAIDEAEDYDAVDAAAVWPKE